MKINKQTQGNKGRKGEDKSLPWMWIRSWGGPEPGRRRRHGDLAGDGRAGNEAESPSRSVVWCRARRLDDSGDDSDHHHGCLPPLSTWGCFPWIPAFFKLSSILFFVVTLCKAAAASSTSLLKLKLAEAREGEEEVGVVAGGTGIVQDYKWTRKRSKTRP